LYKIKVGKISKEIGVMATVKPKQKTASERGKASRRKGKSGELELAHIMQEYGFLDCHRSAQRAGSIESADLIGLPGLHPEVKRVERLNIQKAMEQAIRDSNGSDHIPAVFHRRNGTSWLVTLRLEDFVSYYKAYLTTVE
jgi:hypothetical protein